jgi:hypothetical protein
MICRLGRKAGSTLVGNDSVRGAQFTVSEKNWAPKSARDQDVEQSTRFGSLPFVYGDLVAGRALSSRPRYSTSTAGSGWPPSWSTNSRASPAFAWHWAVFVAQ